MSTEPLSVRELVAITSLRSEVIAGESGLDRRVVWAHSCELQEPWLWLGPDELLMTIGFCVPRLPEEQVQFVRQLDDAGVVGMMLGERDKQLTLSAEMLAEADRRGFPVMLTEHQVPWSAVARHVVAASSVSQTSQVLQLAKLYELTASSAGPQELANNISRLLNVGVSVIEEQGGLAIISSQTTLARGDASVNPAEQSENESPLLARSRVHRLYSRHRALLEVNEPAGFELGAMVLLHLKRILEVETDRVLFRVAEQIEQHERDMNELLIDGDARGVEQRLNLLSVRSGCHIVAFARDQAELVAKAVIVRGITAVVGRNSEGGLLLAQHTEVNHVRELLASLGIAAGVSERFDSWIEVRGAVSEALSASIDAVTNSTDWEEFHGARIAVLARSESEARMIIRDVFGELADDNEKMEVLRDTLFVYLKHERSWAEASRELGIHRQTLSYRLRRIEAITNRVIARTEDLAALWIAVQAWQKFGPTHS